ASLLVFFKHGGLERKQVERKRERRRVVGRVVVKVERVSPDALRDEPMSVCALTDPRLVQSLALENIPQLPQLVASPPERPRKTNKSSQHTQDHRWKIEKVNLGM